MTEGCKRDEIEICLFLIWQRDAREMKIEICLFLGEREMKERGDRDVSLSGMRDRAIGLLLKKRSVAF